MNIRDFLRAGHWPTLLAAFVYFDISFLVWVLLGGLSNHIAADLELTHTQRGLLVATPLLGGTLLRIVLGLLTDRVGARRTALIGLTSTLLPLIMGWLGAHSFAKLLWVGLLLGIAGASFAAALPLAGRWYPPQYQGLALGIAGAGNSGTALATFFAPRLAELVGWQNVFGLAVIPVLTALVVVVLLAREAPNGSSSQPVIRYFRVLREQDSWWLCGFYAVTFGGFVGLASFPQHFLPHPVRCASSRGWESGHYFRAGGFFLTASRRLSGRPIRWRASPDGDLRPGGGNHDCFSFVIPRSLWRRFSSRAHWAFSVWATVQCFSSCRNASPESSASSPV
jgi:nitrate/nitrite transporter NarK